MPLTRLLSLSCRAGPLPVKRDPLDKIFSKCIRESYDYTCCASKKNYRHDPGYLHCAHIHTRKHRATRWLPYLGAIALDAQRHRRFTDYPLEWAEFCRGFLGPEAYDTAKQLAHSTVKFTKSDKADMLEHFKSELKRMEDLRKDGVTGFIRLNSFDGHPALRGLWLPDGVPNGVEGVC